MGESRSASSTHGRARPEKRPAGESRMVARSPAAWRAKKGSHLSNHLRGVGGMRGMMAAFRVSHAKKCCLVIHGAGTEPPARLTGSQIPGERREGM